MRAELGVHQLVRRTVADAGPLTLLAVLVFTTCLLATAGSGYLDRRIDRGLRHDLSRSPAMATDLFLDVMTTRLDPVALDRPEEVQPQQHLPGLLGQVTAPRSISATVPRLTAKNAGQQSSGPDRSLLDLRWDSRMEQAVTLVRGRWPNTRRAAPTTGAAARITPTIEAVVGEPVAKAMGIDQGATFDLSNDSASDSPVDPAGTAPTGPDGDNRAGTPPRVKVTVVGVFAAGDPRAVPLDEVPKAITAVQRDGFPTEATLLTDPAGLATLPVALGTPATLRWRLQIVAQKLRAGQIDELTSAIAVRRRAPASEPKLTTGLDTALVELADQLPPTRILVSVVGIGLFTTVFALLVLAMRLLAQRAAPRSMLLRARGASLVQIAGDMLVEVLPPVVVASATGWAVGLPITSGSPNSLMLAMATATLAAASAAGWAVTTCPLRTSAQRTSMASRRRRPSIGANLLADPRARAARLILVRVSLVVLGVGATMVARQRGFAVGSRPAGSGPAGSGPAGSGPAGSSGDLHPDLLLAAAPTLLAAAVAILLTGLLPGPLRWLARFTATRPGLAAFVGTARAARTLRSTVLPMVVLVIAMATGFLGVTVRSAVSSGRDRLSDRVFAADLTVSAQRFSAGTAARLATLPGVKALAELTEETSQELFVGALSGQRSLGRVTVVVLEPRQYLEVLRLSGMLGRSAEQLEVPRALDAQSDQSAATGSVPPAVISRATAAETGLGLGAKAGVTVQDQTVRFATAGIVDRFLGLGGLTRFVVLARQSLPNPTGLTTTRYQIAGHPDRQQVRAIAEAGGRQFRAATVGDARAGDWANVAVADRRDYRHGLDATAANAVVSFVFAAAGIGAILAGLLAICMAVLADARRRGLDCSRLRTLGMSTVQGTVLTVAELGPLVTVTLIAGGCAGYAVPVLLAGPMDLSTFAAGEPITIGVDPRIWFLLAVCVPLGLVATAAAASLVTRAAGAGSALRLGQEG